LLLLLYLQQSSENCNKPHNPMPIPPNPLSKPHLDKLLGLNDPGDSAGSEEIERRAQELFNEWLKFYFSGNPFPSTESGETISKTFEACSLLYGQATPENPSTKPILHFLLADRRDGDGRRIPGDFLAFDARWTWNILIRSHPQLPASPSATGPATDNAKLTAERVNRRLADQCRWLLLSHHTQDLAVKGIGQIRVENGPRQIPAGASIMRQIVFSARVSYRIPLNEP
jgi:hypothetical protein